MNRSRPLAAAIAGVALAAIALALPAQANEQTVRDQLRETAQLERNGRIDIRKVSAGHRGEDLVHQVVMRKRVSPKRGNERPLLTINTRGGRRSDAEYLVFGRVIFKHRPKGDRDPKPIGHASLRARGRRWTYRFDPAQIPDLGRYGWAVVVTKGDAFDAAPEQRYKLHRP